MKTAVAEIKGVGAISFSRQHGLPKLEGEADEAHDLRTWREHAHYDGATKECFVPGVMFKFALDYTAAQLGMKIKGRGIKTWTTIFESGVICADRLMLGIKRDDLDGITIQCNPRGKRGGGGRVPRRFPIIHEWGGTVQFMILNDMITEEVFRTHLEKAGQFCGLGRYAPRNRGHHGRFEVADLLWHDEVAVAAAE